MPVVGGVDGVTVVGFGVPPVMAILSGGVTGFFASSQAAIAGDGFVSAEIAANKESKSSNNPFAFVFGPSPQS